MQTCQRINRERAIAILMVRKRALNWKLESLKSICPYGAEDKVYVLWTILKICNETILFNKIRNHNRITSQIIILIAAPSSNKYEPDGNKKTFIVHIHKFDWLFEQDSNSRPSCWGHDWPDFESNTLSSSYIILITTLIVIYTEKTSSYLMMQMPHCCHRRSDMRTKIIC